MTPVFLHDRITKNEMSADSDLLHTVIDTVPNPVFIKDPDGTYIMVNKTLASRWNMTIREALGKTDEDLAGLGLLTAEEAERLHRDDLEVLATGAAKDIPEASITASNGRVSWFEIKKIPITITGYGMCVLGVALDITERKETADRLAETNTALKVLLEKRRQDRNEVEQRLLSNVREILIPLVDKLLETELNTLQAAYAQSIATTVNELVSPFARKLSSKMYTLTPTEVQIASFIREGKRTKDIALLMRLSERTVDHYRKNIRRKLGITSKKQSLQSCLLSIS